MYPAEKVDMPVDCEFPNVKMHPSLRNYQVPHRAGLSSGEFIKRARAAYSGMISCFDDSVGKLLDGLESQGTLDNTVVVFISDHGNTMGEHGVFFKKGPYRGSIRVPVIIQGPGIPAGRKGEEVVSLIDLFPTLQDLMGLTPDESVPDRLN
jgi:choline-sulfatase